MRDGTGATGQLLCLRCGATSETELFQDEPPATQRIEITCCHRCPDDGVTFKVRHVDWSGEALDAELT